MKRYINPITGQRYFSNYDNYRYSKTSGDCSPTPMRSEWSDDMPYHIPRPEREPEPEREPNPFERTEQ